MLSYRAGQNRKHFERTRRYGKLGLKMISSRQFKTCQKPVAAVEAELARGREDPLLSRIMRICDPGRPGRSGAFTFLPTPGLDMKESWQLWMTNVFEPHLLDRLVRVMRYAAQGYAREIRDLDAEIGAVLSSRSRQSSLEAGQQLLGCLSNAQGERMINKLTLWHETGHFAGHFATLYALQCAVFGFPIRQSLLCYLRHEWMAVSWRHASLQGHQLFLDTLEHLTGHLVKSLRNDSEQGTIIYHDFAAKVS